MSPAWKIHHPKEQAKVKGIFAFHELGGAKIRYISPRCISWTPVDTVGFAPADIARSLRQPLGPPYGGPRREVLI
jgi:hypothetical protein